MTVIIMLSTPLQYCIVIVMQIKLTVVVIISVNLLEKRRLDLK